MESLLKNKEMEKEMKWKQLSEKLDLNDATLDYLISHLNKDREEHLKMMLMYIFICDGLLSYEKAAEILGINCITLLDTYDDYKCSTSALSYDELKDMFVKSGLLSINDIDKADAKFKEVEYANCSR